jgi:circadian clock protein KaiC
MKTSDDGHSALERLKSGIPGLDAIACGGLPKGRTCLVAGTAGSGKTVIALQFLAAGVTLFDEPGVLATFEETPEDMLRNVRSFDWGIAELVDRGKIAVVDGTPVAGEALLEAGAYDLSALLARIEHAVREVGAQRVILDAVGGLFLQFTDAAAVRRELHRIHLGLRQLGVTTLISMERTDEGGGIGRFGVEEFVADNVILLRNRLEQEKRRRTIEIVKFRGAPHQKGEYPFTIDPDSGVTIIPLSAIELGHKASDARISSGVSELDEMCGGGYYLGSIILVSGATGTGKSLTVTEFLKAAIEAGERALLFGAEENRDQIERNAASWGVDFEQAQRSGLLRIICRYPEALSLEDHLVQMKRDMHEFGPARVAVDSLSAFERVSTPRSFREFVISLTGYIKQLEITGLFTNTTPMVAASQSPTEDHTATITDTIVLLRYVELLGEMRRGITVLKMRGTSHQKMIREYVINSDGMHIKEPFRGVSGILSGAPTFSYAQERQRLRDMFSSDDEDLEP